MENKEYQCLSCKAISGNSIKCHHCGSVEIIRLPLPAIPAVDELNLDERALEYCKHMGYSKTGSQYSAYITAWNDSTQQKQDKVVEVIMAKIELCERCAAEETDELIRNIHHGVAAELYSFINELKAII